MPESLQNRQLHDIFAEHAPQAVDVEAGWARVQPHLTSSKSPAYRLPIDLRSPRRIIAATVVLAIVLTSASFLMGFAFNHICFTGGTPFLCSDIPQLNNGNFFQVINQQQTVNGVTITITSVYADRGATLIAFTTQLPPSLAAQYEGAFPADLMVTSLSGEQAATPENGPVTLCDDPARNHNIVACYQRFGPLHPGASARTIEVTVSGSGFYLHRNAIDAKLDAPWQFHFTMNFAQQNRHLIATPPTPDPNKIIQLVPTP